MVRTPAYYMEPPPLPPEDLEPPVEKPVSPNSIIIFVLCLKELTYYNFMNLLMFFDH